GQCGLDLPQAIGLDEFHSIWADGHSALGVGLGVLVDQRPACDPYHAAGDEDLAIVQVDISPLEAAELAAARAEDHGQAQEEAELRILVPCYLEYSGDPWSVGRRAPGRAGGRCSGLLARVVGDPAPHQRLSEGSGQD